MSFSKRELNRSSLSGFPLVLLCTVITLLLALTPTTHAATNDLTTLLQRGLFEEEANRNLDAAISNYQSLANDFNKDRQLAATAIFRLGECYRKLGRTNEAVAQYQRIVREFSDQQTLATLSQQNLAGLGAVQNSSEAATSVLNRLEQRREAERASDSLQELQTDLTKEKASYDEKQTLLDTLKKMNRHNLRNALPTLVPDNQLNTLLSELDLAEQNLLNLKHDYAETHPKYVSAKEAVDALSLKVDNRIEGILVGLQAQLDASKAHQDWIQQRIKLAEQSSGTQAAAALKPFIPPITSEEDNEIRRIQQMIQNSPDLINAPSGDPMMTPLERAASLGQLRVAKFLIEAKADINQRSGDMNPLELAAWNGHRAMIELLLTNGAAMNATDSDGRTALHLAAERGFVSVAEALLAAKADVNARGPDGNTPLTFAVQHGSLPTAELLLSHGADPNIVAAKRPQRGPTDINVGAPLHFAVVRGDEPMVSLLLSNHANVELRSPLGKTALDLAAETGNVQIGRHLLDAGANPNSERTHPGDPTSLYWAVEKGNTNIASLLLARGADPNQGATEPGNTVQASVTPLMRAVRNGNEAMVAILLQNKADPNIRNEDGFTAFWYGFYTSVAKSLVPLLEYGADPNQTNSYSGFTPLMGVANSDHFNSATDRVAVAKLLIEKGADVNARDNDGQTALHVAVSHNRPEMVELLLANKADVNVADKSGKTPLNYATGSQSPQMPGTIMTTRPMLPGRPSFQANNANPPSPKIDMVALLRGHGALDALPDFNHIRVMRQGKNDLNAIFHRAPEDWNKITLFDVLGVQYDLISASPSGNRRNRALQPGSNFPVDNSLPFPDFSRIIIHRPSADGTSSKDIKVDAAQLLDSGNCAADVPLQFGDVVEIPEADHVMYARWTGLDTNVLFHLTDCVTRHVQVTVKGNTSNLTLIPDIGPGGNGEVTTYMVPGKGPVIGPTIVLSVDKPMMLWPALEESKLLLASSDISRIKVKRRDTATGKTSEWTVDCSDPSSPPNFWLRDGDIIEVPEKPE